MKNKILEKLKTKAVHLGLKDSILNFYSEKLAKDNLEEENIDTAIDGIFDELKLFQSVSDEWRTKYKKISDDLEEFKKKSISSASSSQPQEQSEPEWAKKIKDFFEKQQLLLQEQEEKNKEAQQNALFLEILKKEGVSEAFYQLHLGKKFENETQIHNFVNQLKEQEKVYLQGVNNKGLTNHTQGVLGSQMSSSEVSSEVKDLFGKNNEK